MFGGAVYAVMFSKRAHPGCLGCIAFFAVLSGFGDAHVDGDSTGAVARSCGTVSGIQTVNHLPRPEAEKWEGLLLLYQGSFYTYHLSGSLGL